MRTMKRRLANKAVAELFLLIAGTIGIAFIIREYDMSAWQVIWNERIHLYTGMELPAAAGASAFLLVGACVWLWRRWIESQREIELCEVRERELGILSQCDLVTNLYNKNMFEQYLDDPVCMTARPVGVVVCDVDGLKLVNDALGHAEGDRLIKIVGAVIRQLCGPRIKGFRVGGDEFALLLSPTTEAETAAVATSVADRVAGSDSSASQLPSRVSVGYAVSKDQQSLREVFRQADALMYEQKLRSKFVARTETVRRLEEIIDRRVRREPAQVERMERWLVLIANELGFEEYKVNNLRLLARFHDLGKISLPDELLQKSGLLDDQQYDLVKRHSVIGYRIALTSAELSAIADWILLHHENWDGSGYPLGKQGRDIPLECRIFRVVNEVDAMTYGRPYRKAVSYDEAMLELLRSRGSKYDPQLVDLIAGGHLLLK